MRLWNSSWTSMAFTLQMTETGLVHKTRIEFLVLLLVCRQIGDLRETPF